MALNARQELFIIEYLKCFNATKAALAAGYSEKSASETGCELLKNPKVAARIREHLDNNAMTAAEVLAHLADIARGDISEVVDANGNLDMAAARRGKKTGLIRKIRQRSVTTEESDIAETEIEMHDRLRALELLGKHHKLFTDKQEITGADGTALTVNVTYAKPNADTA